MDFNHRVLVISKWTFGLFLTVRQNKYWIWNMGSLQGFLDILVKEDSISRSLCRIQPFRSSGEKGISSSPGLSFVLGQCMVPEGDYLSPKLSSRTVLSGWIVKPQRRNPDSREIYKRRQLPVSNS